jgi:hypothetical protein
MRCDVYCGTVIALKDSILDYGNAHTTNVPDLPIGANYPARDIATAVLLMHPLYCFGQGDAVLGMERSKELLKVWSPVCRVKTKDLVDFVRPIDV